MDPASDLITFDSLRRNAPCLNADFRGMLIDRTEGDFDNGVLRPNGQSQPRSHGPAQALARTRCCTGFLIPLHMQTC